MKNLKMLYIALIALVAGAFGACTNEFEPGPQASGPQVSFADTNVTSVEFTGAEGESTQKLILNRVETANALMVDIIAEVEKGAEKLFSFPEIVVFEAGQDTAELVYTVDHEKFENDKTYKVKLYLLDEVSTPYGCNEWSVSFALNPWELLKDSKGNNAKGKLRGVAMMDGFWGVSSSEEINVNVYQHKQKKQYKVENPWLTLYMVGFGATEEELAGQFSWVPADLIIDFTDPNNVTIPQQSIGITENIYGYGEGYVIGSGGTLSEGVITFPVEGIGYIHAALASSYGWIPCNTDGSFRLVLPGVEVADYSLDVVYDGMDVAADNKTTTAKFKFTYGADVTGIDYMIVTGNKEDQASALLSTLVAGEDKNILSVENFEQGKGVANVRIGLESGLYTIVAAAKDKNGSLTAKTALVKSFYFAGIGNTEEHPCEIGVITAKFSEAYPSYASQYPDYSALAYCIYGTGIKSAKYLVAKASAINNMIASGADLETLVNEYGYDVEAKNLPKVNSENGWVSNAINLDAATEYTIAVYATNEYGESALATATHTTDAAPTYTGELAIGQYFMSCNVEMKEGVQTFENVFTVTPNGEDGTKFFISDLGFNDGGQHKFHATYDATASTLTVDGTYKGMEDYGSLFGGMLYGELATSDATYSYTIFSYNSAESKGKDPIVFGVDPTTKQISSLQTLEFEVAAFVPSGNSFSYVGSFAIFQGAGTTIEPYTASAASSVKKASLINTPLRAAINNVNTLRNKFAVKSVAISKAEKMVGKSVKPSLVEKCAATKKAYQYAKANIR